MKKVILHIGIPKTGSSALQHYFYYNKKAFERVGVGYFIPEYRFTPWDTRSNAHFVLAEVLNTLSIADTNNKYRMLEKYPSLNVFQLKLDKEKTDNLKKVKESFKEYARKYDVLILSEEVIWHYDYFYNNYWKVYKDYLEDCIDDCEIDVVIYLRRQDKWIESKWKEDMRNELPLPLSFIETLNLYEEIGYLDYYSSLKRIEKVFGKNHLKVRNFERNTFVKGSIINDFLSINPSIIVPIDAVDNNYNVNQSISIETAHAMSLINKGIVNIWPRNSRYYFGSNFFSNVFSKETKAVSVMDREEIINLLNRYKEGNQKISCEYNNSKLFFDDKVEDVVKINPNLRKDKRNAHFISLIVKYEKQINDLMLLKRKIFGAKKIL